MSASFLDHVRDIEDGRIAGMTTYPLDEVLLTVLVGLLCKMDDTDDISTFCDEQIDWLRRYLPFENGVAPAQTLSRALRALDPKALARRLLRPGSPACRRGSPGRPRASWRSRDPELSEYICVRGRRPACRLGLCARSRAGAGGARGSRPRATRSLRSPNSSTCWRSKAPSSPSTPWERKRPSPPKSSRRRQTLLLALQGKSSPPCMPMSKSFSPIRRWRRPASNVVKPTPATAGSRSARPASQTPAGSQNAIRSGRDCNRSRRSDCLRRDKKTGADLEGNAVLHLVPAARPRRFSPPSRSHWRIESAPQAHARRRFAVMN